MSNLLQNITLAITQGLTEFLPISSSAHLILVPTIAGWQDQGIYFDIAVHVGSLLAVFAYFRKDIILLIQGFFRSLRTGPKDFYSTLPWQLILATFPIAIVGFFAHDFVATTLRSPLVIAMSTMGFGVLLLASDHYSAHQKAIQQMKWKDIALIGLAQTLALIPGTSRSGITLTAGLALGFDRKSAAKFSFLLSMPVIILAGAYEGYKMAVSPDPLPWNLLIIGIACSGLTAYACIHFFMQFIQKIGMLPFVIYRLILGCFLLFLFY
jgi:undecaprenyl-diphosphatase